MAETIGKITDIKVMSFLQGTMNAFDIANITVKETGTRTSGCSTSGRVAMTITPVHRVWRANAWRWRGRRRFEN